MGKKNKGKIEVVHSITSLGMPEVRPLYPADDGSPILTNSMLTAFRRCKRQAMYKYVDRLKPKMLGKPLKRGTWVHLLLEEDARGGDWKKLHAKLTKQFGRLFDEEKEFYGDLPTEIEHLMRSYFWHYKRDPWKYHELELELTARLPDGTLLRIKFDALVENQFGLWLVDHKTHKTLPKLAYRTLDTQSPIYTWVAWQNNIPVQGFIWNYIRWKAPSHIKLAYAGKSNERLSTRAIETDYPTLKKDLREFDPKYTNSAEIQAKLRQLKAQRYKPGGMQSSPFFLRSVMEKDESMVNRVLKEGMRTARDMNTYDFADRDGVERTVGRHCEFMCSYTDLCTAELLGGNTRPLIKQNYEVGDPMSYYHDRAGETDKVED